MTETEEAVARLKHSVSALRYDDLMTILTALERAERERDASAAKAADWQAIRDERDAMIGNYHNLYRDTEGDIAMANLRAQSAEAALTDLKAEAVEVVEALANAADGVGVAYFDSDDMPPVVETMQDATLAARDLLAKLKGEGQ